MPEDILKQCTGKGAKVNLEARYKHMTSDRSGYLERGMEYSTMTLPYILPQSNSTNTSNQHGFQSIGAQGVNHLSNKLVTNLFPVNRSFFIQNFDEEAKASIKEINGNLRELTKLLVTAEKKCETLQTKIAARVAYTEALKNLIVTGNVCMHLPAEGNLQAIKLNSFCVERDLSGRTVELMIEESKAFSTLSEETQSLVRKAMASKNIKGNDDVKIYTWIYRRSKNTFVVAQTVSDIMLQKLQTVEEDKLPWIVVPWNLTHGENYGRGLVEDHAGDLHVVEFLSEAIAKGMALMADIKYFLKPGSVIDINEAASSPTGEWLFGSLDDIGILQLERYADFTPIAEVLEKYERRLGQAFLINSAMRRDAERVECCPL